MLLFEPNSDGGPRVGRFITTIRRGFHRRCGNQQPL